MDGEARLLGVLRSHVARSMLALACLVVLTGFGSWSGRPLVNGYYVSRGSAASIIMVRLVEAPRGHVNGALVVTTANQVSAAPDVSRHTLQGSIAGGNVTLKTPGLFGLLSAVYVGTLDGDRLTLSLEGHSPFTLYLTSATDYQDRLAALNQVQANVNSLRNARHLIRDTTAYLKRLNASIAQYVTWGRTRVAHQNGVRLWWAKKVKYYDACLAKIRPLAAAGVPEWRWNQCAMTVRNDAWNREQEVSLIKRDQHINAVQSAAIQHMLIEAPIKVRTTAHAMHSACPYSSSPKTCEKDWDHWHAAASSISSLVPAARLADFHTLLPQVQKALRNDAEITATVNARLQLVATQVVNILNEPQKYRRT